MMIVFAKLAIENKLQNFLCDIFQIFQKSCGLTMCRGFCFFQTGEGKYSDPKTEEKIFFAARLFFRKSSLIQ